MPKPRKSLVSLEATPYYHCVSRCVRRAFLCGEDVHTGKNFEHRRQWIEDRLLKLSTIFAIDIAAYAVMSNHYHVVLHINQHKATDWSERDVIEHWHKLFKGNLFSQKYLSGEALHEAEKNVLDQMIEEWRSRLSSISWFMRCANEPIAREANKEDSVSGRFWEGRFKSQALLDEKALAACMAYVDLNPIRAKMATNPEQSDHTSVQRRIKQALNHKRANDLYPFAGNPRKDMPEGIPFHLTDYLELVDWTGRILREDKRGAIPDNLPTILQRLNIDTRNWLYLSTTFESPFKNLVGTANNVRAACNELGKQWTHGIRQCEEIFSSG
jgi:REP element-mobilizing transposase RayT